MSRSYTLLFAPGTCARVPLTALEEIGASFEAKVVVFMAGEHRTPDFLALNPSGKVPVLVTGEGPIVQNAAILWYLARQHPEAELLPPATSPLEEAHVISQLARFGADLHPLVTRIVLPRLFASEPEAQAQVRRSGEEALAFQLEGFEQVLAARPWLGGERWSVLDSYLGWIWFRATGAGFEGSAFPAIAEHYARLSQRPAVQRALAREAQAQDELEARGLAVPALKNR